MRCLVVSVCVLGLLLMSLVLAVVVVLLLGRLLTLVVSGACSACGDAGCKKCRESDDGQSVNHGVGLRSGWSSFVAAEGSPRP